jgi:hypothetical protein
LAHTRRQVPEDASAFAATTNVVFIERALGEEPEKRISISRPEEVKCLINAVRLRKKAPCECCHLVSAEFRGPSQTIQVSFCSHCFDILNPDNPRSYEGARLYNMPKEFYAQVLSYVQQRTNEQWHLPPARRL